MRNYWTQGLIVPLACVMLSVGCGRGDNAADHRAAQDAAGSSEQISLNGCIGVAPGSANQFALEHVRVTSHGEQRSDALAQSSASAITAGSWVRLTMGDNDQLRARVGERVTIVGTIRDDGRDRVGTSGPQPGPQQPDPRPNESRAGADAHHSEKVAQEVGPMGQQSMATGTAPLILVQRIEGTGEQCNPDLRQPENRR